MSDKLWYLGAMNDGLFIIDQPPRPSTDDVWHGRPDGPNLVLNVTDLPTSKAQAICDAHNAALTTASASAAEPIDAALVGIDGVVKESGGWWKPCSGCYDTEDGHPTRKYDHSRALKTDVGCGCNECGGLGAVWEYYSESDLAAMQEVFGGP